MFLPLLLLGSWNGGVPRVANARVFNTSYFLRFSSKFLIAYSMTRYMVHTSLFACRNRKLSFPHSLRHSMWFQFDIMWGILINYSSNFITQLKYLLHT